MEYVHIIYIVIINIPSRQFDVAMLAVVFCREESK